MSVRKQVTFVSYNKRLDEVALLHWGHAEHTAVCGTDKKLTEDESDFQYEGAL